MATVVQDRRESRRAAVIAAARKSFFEHGYAATSMSAIAKAVGGSKTTLWNCFPSKEALFAAVLDDLIGEYRAELSGLLDRQDDVALTLGRYARAILRKLSSERAMRLRRLIFAEVDRFPEIGRLYYERGPEQSQRTLAVYLAEAMAAGKLRPADPLAAASHLHQLTQAGGYVPRLLKLGGTPDPLEIEADADAAIDIFLRAYAPGGSPHAEKT